LTTNKNLRIGSLEDPTLILPETMEILTMAATIPEMAPLINSPRKRKKIMAAHKTILFLIRL
jgi:hypothetical protein